MGGGEFSSHMLSVALPFQYKVSPIETAIETLDSTNKKLSTAIEQQITDPKTRIGTLGMLLNGVVDAAVQGGVSNWKHFYADDYGKTDKEKGFAKQLKALTKDQVISSAGFILFETWWAKL